MASKSGTSLVAALGTALALSLCTSVSFAAAPAQGGAPTVPIPGAPIEVDLQLVLAVDVSGSIDSQEAELQRKGTADAFRSKEVINAIRSGSLGRIAVTEVNFASRQFGVLSVPINWQIIRDEKSANDFADKVMAVEHVSGRGTSLSDAIDLSARLLEKTQSIHGIKQVIDISSDGVNNAGRPVLMARDEALAQGITINALPIIDETTPQDLDKYFMGCVTGGAGNFVLVAKGFTDFARAIRRKLVLEISGLTPNEATPPGKPHIVKVAATTAPGGQGIAPRPNFSRPLQTNPPYPAGCDFPMFGGYFGRF